MEGDYCPTTLFGAGAEQEVNHHANRLVRHSQHRGAAPAAPAAPATPGSRPLVLSQTKTTMGPNRWKQQRQQEQQRQMPQMQQQQMHCSEYGDYDMQMATQHTHMSGEQQGQGYPQQRPPHSSSFRQQHSTRSTTPPSSSAQAAIALRRPAIQSMTPRHQQMPMQVPMQMQMLERQTPASQMRLRQNANNENRRMAFRTPQQQNPLYMNNNIGTSTGASAGYSQQSARSVRQRTMQRRYISRDGNGTESGVGATGGVGTGTYERNGNENVDQNPFQDFNYQMY